jgi:hypothetical protein
VLVPYDRACTTFTNTQSVLFGPPSNGSAGGFDTIAFGNPQAAYVAASGDWGTVPIWPAVSPRVLSVGGTDARSATDVAWGNSGGGTSLYYPKPAYQAALPHATRAVPDVAMVADRYSPVSFHVTSSATVPASPTCVATYGADACSWYGGYGTSVGAPIWSGLAAIARAIRAEQFKGGLDLASALYALGSNPATAPVVFQDVVSGSRAGVGHDLVTGFGVPRSEALVSALAGL